jgi:hypothetical protein
MDVGREVDVHVCAALLAGRTLNGPSDERHEAAIRRLRSTPITIWLPPLVNLTAFYVAYARYVPELWSMACAMWSLAHWHTQPHNCRTLPHTTKRTAAHCGVHYAHCAHTSTVRTVTHGHPLPHTAAHCSAHCRTHTVAHTAAHCHTLPHTATHCSTLPHTAHTLPHTAAHCRAHCHIQRRALPHTATHADDRSYFERPIG